MIENKPCSCFCALFLNSSALMEIFAPSLPPSTTSGPIFTFSGRFHGWVVGGGGCVCPLCTCRFSPTRLKSDQHSTARLQLGFARRVENTMPDIESLRLLCSSLFRMGLLLKSCWGHRHQLFTLFVRQLYLLTAFWIVWMFDFNK